MLRTRGRRRVELKIALWAAVIAAAMMFAPGRPCAASRNSSSNAGTRQESLSAQLAAANASNPAAAGAPAPGGDSVDTLLEPPLGEDGKPVKVSVQLIVLNLTDVDEVSERFHVDAHLLMRWNDPRLRFTPQNAAERTDPRSYAVGQIWTPDLELVNGVGARQVGEVQIRVRPNGDVLYAERFSAAVSSRFALKRFPFDAQKLLLILRPFGADRDRMVFESDPGDGFTALEFQQYSSLASWRVQGVQVTVGKALMRSGAKVPEVRFEIGVKRKFAFYIYKIFLPLILMVMLSWMVFWIEPRDLSNQVQIAVTTILTIIAFAFAISANLPRVPYLTFIDAFFLTCYIFVFVAMLELMTVNVMHRRGGEDFGLRIRRLSRWAVPLAFVIVNVIMVIHYRIGR